MKKFFTILALVLVVAMCASFAVSAETVEIKNVTSNNTSSKDITVAYDAIDDAPVVYSVDVTWGTVAFSFNAGTQTYNPESHTTTANTPNGTWTVGSSTVEVFNHSNAAVDVEVAFTTGNNGDAGLTITNGEFTLISAEGLSTDGTDDIKKTATLTATGVPASNAKLGTVTVTITAAN